MDTADERDWQRVIQGLPWSPETHLQLLQRFLCAQLLSGKSEAVKEGAHGFWELAQRRENHRRLVQDA
eukprot:278045-Pyramimonas_sp.AAC.1